MSKKLFIVVQEIQFMTGAVVALPVKFIGDDEALARRTQTEMIQGMKALHQMCLANGATGQMTDMRFAQALNSRLGIKDIAYKIAVTELASEIVLPQSGLILTP